MTSQNMPSMAEPAVEDSSRATPAVPWATIGLLGTLLCILFAPTLYSMVREWFLIEEMGHGIFVPFVAGYIAWQNRHETLAAPIKPSWWGLPLVLWGFVQQLLGYLGADFFVARTALFPSLVGLILLCAGWQVLRTLLFPLFVLLFMIRLPLFIYSQLTFPLQLLASRIAEASLMMMDIPVLRDGNILELASQKLSVVEACSGIRSVISLGFLALVYGFFFDRKPWMKWVLIVLSVPIAIIANAARVTLTGVISEVKKEFAEGIYHSLEGWVIFMVALVFLLMTHHLLNRIHAVATK